jgi:hypothetical protein
MGGIDIYAILFMRPNPRACHIEYFDLISVIA